MRTARAAANQLLARKAGGLAQQSGAYFRQKTGADGPVLRDSLKNQSLCSTGAERWPGWHRCTWNRRRPGSRIPAYGFLKRDADPGAEVRDIPGTGAAAASEPIRRIASAACGLIGFVS